MRVPVISLSAGFVRLLLSSLLLVVATVAPPAQAVSFGTDCVPTISPTGPLNIVVPAASPNFTVGVVDGGGTGACTGMRFDVAATGGNPSDFTPAPAMATNNLLFGSSSTQIYTVTLPAFASTVTYTVTCAEGCSDNPAQLTRSITLNTTPDYELVAQTPIPASILVGESSNIAVIAQQAGSPVAGAVVNWSLFANCGNPNTGISFTPVTSPATGSDGRASSVFATSNASSSDNYCIEAQWISPGGLRSATLNVNVDDSFAMTPTAPTSPTITVAPAQANIGVNFTVNGTPVSNGLNVDFEVTSFAPRVMGTPADYLFGAGSPNLPGVVATSGGVAATTFRSNVEGTYQIRVSHSSVALRNKNAIKGGSSIVAQQLYTVLVQRGRTLVIQSGNNNAGQSGETLTLEVRAQDDGANASDSINWSVVSGPGTLSAPSSSTAAGVANNTFLFSSTPGATRVRAERQSDSAVFVEFDLENYVYQISQVGGNTRAGNENSDIGFQVRVDRVGISTVAASGKTVNWTQSGPATGTFKLQGSGAPATSSTTDAGGIAAIDFNTATGGSYTIQGAYTAEASPPPVFLGSTPPTFSASFATTVNRAPSFSSTAALSATQGSLYSYAVVTADPEAGSRTITAGTLPGWLSLVDNGNGTATLSGTPGNGDVGAVNVQLTVTDTGGLTAQQSFTITVANLNDLPTFTSSPVVTAASGEPYSYSITTGDIDLGDTRSISAVTRPAWLTFTDNGNGTALLAGTPADADVGQANAVLLQVTDAAAGSTQQSFSIAVAPAPVLKTLRKPTTGSGDGQIGVPGSALAQSLIVVAENDGNPAVGQSILWNVSGGAVLSSSSTVTDINGESAITVTLPPTEGSSIITASRADAPAATTSFVATSQAGATVLTRISGDGQIGLPTRSGDDLVVRVDVAGAPVTGAQVNWQVMSGDATLTAAASISDSTGTARVGIQFGASSGPVAVQATSGSGSTVFNLNVGAPQLDIVSGNNQTGPVAAELGEDFVVRIGAAPGKPSLDGFTVTWEVVTGGGVVTPSTSITDSAGQARARLTLGPNPGLNQVRARIGDSSVLFTASAATALLERVGGDLQRGLVGTEANQPLSVLLKSQTGAPIADAEIRWSVISGGATLAQPTTRTDGSGRSGNRLRFAAPAGPVVIQAETDAVPLGVRFTAVSENPGVSNVGGNDQSGVAGQPLAQQLSFQVNQPAGKSLEGVPVSWQVTTGGGSLTASTTTSDAQGFVRNAWTLGPSTGQQRVIAQVPGGQQVSFVANAQPAGGSIGVITVVSGNLQSLTTNTDSQPLVVQVKSPDGTPVEAAQLVWSGENATVSRSTTSTDAEGKANVIARVTLPGTGKVTVRLRDSTQGAVAFTLTGTVSVPDAGDGDRGAGDAVDLLCPALAALTTRTPEQEDLFQRCREFADNAGNNPGEVQTALDELPTDIGTTLSNTGIESINTQFDNLDLRLHMVRGEQFGGRQNQFNLALWTPDGSLPLSFLPSAVVAAADEESAQAEEAGVDFDRWGFFATGQIGRGEVEAGSRSPKFDFDLNGLTAGVDYRFSDRLIGGVAAGYSSGDTELANSRGTLDSSGWSVSGYATWFSDRAWYVDGTLLYGRSDYELDRRVSYSIRALDGSRTTVNQIAKSNTDGDQLGMTMSVGRDWQKGPWSLNGYLKGAYSRVETDAYAERMLANQPGQGLALAIDARSTKSITSIVGGRATYVMSRDWGILMPTATLEWEHEFQDDPNRLTARFLFDPTATPIEQVGDDVDANYFNVGLGVSALFPGGRSAFLYYEELVGATRLSQGILSLGVRVEF